MCHNVRSQSTAQNNNTAQINFVLYNIMYFRKQEFENEIVSKLLVVERGERSHFKGLVVKL